MPPIRSGDPHGGDGEGSASATTTAWTGEKKRKVVVLASPAPSDLQAPPPINGGDAPHQGDQSPSTTCCDSHGAAAMDIQFQDHQGKAEALCKEEEEFVFSEQDVISFEEHRARAHTLIAYEESHFVDPTGPRLRGQELTEDKFNSLTLFRLRDYMSSIGDAILDDTDIAAALEKCPAQILNWTHEPNWTYDFMLPGALDWNFDPQYWDLAALNDYQRMIVTKFSHADYFDWGAYRVTFADYKTDEDYVNYCDALSKKIKWIEQYANEPCLPRDISRTNEYAQKSFITCRQAIKIAAGFPRMTFTLAMRGHSEYIWSLRDYILYIHDYIQLTFEVWKRVTKREMSFLDALKEVHSKNIFPDIASVLQYQINKGNGDIKKHFDICMAEIGSKVLTDAEAEQKIAYTFRNVIFKRRKIYVEYARMKLEIGRRIGLIPPS